MEPKKIKKLTLHKETIANLSDTEMKRQKGGWDNMSIFALTCVQSALLMGNCSCVTGCADCLLDSYAECWDKKSLLSWCECYTQEDWSCEGNCVK